MLQSKLLDGLNHCFTERSDYFCPERVDFYAQMMGVESFIRPKQVHGDHIEIDPTLNEGVKSSSPPLHASLNREPSVAALSNLPLKRLACESFSGFEADAVILTQKGRGLVMNFADCTPIILFDPICKIAAGVHAGWRGTAAQIARKTAAKMIELGSAPEKVRAAIGPCISKCCFEVTEEVVEALQPFTVFEPKGEKFMVDLKETNRRQLEAIGVKNIDILPNCTVCENERFFSYRLTKTDKRHNIILAL